jgi:hypothetical protein
LDLHSSVPQLFHYENGDVLLLVTIQGCPKDNAVYIPIHIVRNRDIID